MDKFKNIQEVKEYFKKIKVQSSVHKDEWEKIVLAFQAGTSFFLDYARLHFLEMHYQTILKDFRQIGESGVISKDLVNSIYLVAKKSLEENRFVPAHDLFYLLSVMTPDHFDVWIGLGLAYQQTHQNQEAVRAFEQAKQLQPESAFPYLYAAESYVELQDWKTARENCDQGLAYAGHDQKVIREALKTLKKRIDS